MSRQVFITLYARENDFHVDVRTWTGFSDDKIRDTDQKVSKIMIGIFSSAQQIVMYSTTINAQACCTRFYRHQLTVLCLHYFAMSQTCT